MRRIVDAGLLGYAICFAATLGDSFRALERYYRVFTEAVTFHIENAGPSGFADGKATVHNIAAKLGVPPRSLAVDDVAFLLGYGEASTCYRSFKTLDRSDPSGVPPPRGVKSHSVGALGHRSRAFSS